LELAAKARRESLLGLSADMPKVKERDIFEYGLCFVIDGVAPEIIEEVLGNIVAQEKDEYARLYKTIQKRAVLGIQQGYNSEILHSILNSFTDISLKDDNAYEAEKVEKVEAEFGDNDPEIAKALLNKTFVFEDIARLGNFTIKRILQELDPGDLAIALLAASENAQSKMSKYLQGSATQLIMNCMGPASAEKAEEAQQKIAGIIIKLADTCEIYCCDAMNDARLKDLMAT
jgi:hypothetical protein